MRGRTQSGRCVYSRARSGRSTRGPVGETSPRPECEWAIPCDVSRSDLCCNTPYSRSGEVRGRCECRTCHPRRDRAHDWYRDDATHAHCTRCVATIAVTLGLDDDVPRARMKRTGPAKCPATETR